MNASRVMRTEGGRRLGRAVAVIALASSMVCGTGLAAAAGFDGAALYQQGGQGGSVVIGDNANDNDQVNTSGQGHTQTVSQGGGDSANSQGQSTDQENVNANDQSLGLEGSANGGDGGIVTIESEESLLADEVSDTMVATIVSILLALLAGA